MLNAMGWLQACQAGPKRVEKPEATEDVSLPVRLESPVTVEVKRLRVMRSEEEKEREEEVLVVDDIESMKSEKVKFDVYVNACPGNEEGIGPESTHFAGSFVRLGMRLGRSEMMRTRLRLGIGELLTVERD
ncbi:uncharacterized protein A4U43_C04F4180 [Asparagus officinalis]|uniref:Polyphenol oxidase C-terminal domain-containing protein n=1 Tax=Asparagus officinalis TaxID=4686 RepID=A0A5P1F2M9_ASPOF|nr:uncharacterized protein A4U43_C04F4180 [Asparagus officinalis]